MTDKNKEKRLALIIQDLQWQLSFEDIDWEYFIETAQEPLQYVTDGN